MMGWGHGWGRGWGGSGMGHMWGVGGGGILGILGSLLGLLFVLGLLALLALAAIWLLRRNRTLSYGTVGRGSTVSDPLDLAKRRLAKGEITIQEYEHLRNELRS